jgi:hypothetical protein
LKFNNQRRKYEMAQRVYKYATVFNARIINMRNLWEPSREYMGKPAEKPNYLASFIVPKTRANWFEEPQFAGLTQAGQELYNASMSAVPFPQIIWPIKDGDNPEPGKQAPDWMRGHWYLTGSSSSPISVEIVQAGVPVKLMNRAQVKPGDFIAAGLALAVNSNNPRMVKCYMNSVLFMGPGEEIAVGNSITGSELMAKAKEQGLNVTGFGGQSAGLLPQVGFGGQPLGPTGPRGPGSETGAPAGFTPSTVPSGALTGPSGFAPPPVQPPASPSGFGGPAGFTPPAGFPQR